MQQCKSKAAEWVLERPRKTMKLDELCSKNRYDLRSS